MPASGATEAGVSAKRDYYEVLGVERSAQEAEIKSAYRKIAFQHHPDRNSGDKAAEEKFKEASEAYAVLSDPDKRRRYDQFGHAGLGGSGFPGVDFRGEGFGFSGSINDIFSDIFGDFFGGGRRTRGGAQRGSDLRYNLEIGFTEAAFGTEAKITIPRDSRCRECHGSGAKPGTSPKPCATCGGTGELRLTQGFFTVARPCNRCGGAGQVIADPCKACGGRGKVSSEIALTVKIPPGADTGTRLRLAGEGEPGDHGGPPGDLYVVLHVKEHPIFSREDTEILCEVPISFVQAALGGMVDVPTLEGRHSLKVPAGTQSGKVIRLKGKGMPSLNGHGRGDEHVRLVVETPAHLSAEQKALLQKFADLSGEDTHPQTKSFLRKVKELFGGS
jgi:molecular chaperone DnaJ